MSSLAATQADGYYLPPEYFEGGAYKKQSKNAFAASQDNSQGQQRSQGHNQYLQNGIVRFELPYKGICDGCQQSIGRGTRFNAKKLDTNEKYFSTPVWEFQLTCRNCQHPWVIRTNPRERGFDYVKGVRMQAGQEINLAAGESISSIGATTTSTDQNNSNDVGTALDKLESAAHGKRRALTELEELQGLQKLQHASTLHDADNNARIRESFRKDRHHKRKRQQEAAKIGWRQGMELISDDTHNPQDILAAKETTYGMPKEEERKRLKTVRSSSIFSTSLAILRRKPVRTNKKPTRARSSQHSSILNNDLELVPSCNETSRDRQETEARTMTMTTTTAHSGEQQQHLLFDLLNNVGIYPLELLNHLLETNVLKEADARKAVDSIQQERNKSSDVKVKEENTECAKGSHETSEGINIVQDNDHQIGNNDDFSSDSDSSNHKEDHNSPSDHKDRNNNSNDLPGVTTTTSDGRRTRHVALQFCYDGSHYSGLAQNIGQENDKSVEKALFQALLKAKLIDSRETCGYSRCGRTDRGVSAAGQVVALRLTSAIPFDASWKETKQDDSSQNTIMVANKDLPKNEYESIPVWVYPRFKSKKNNNDQEVQDSKPASRILKEVKEYPYTKILNNLLPPFIRVLGWAPVSDDFSARFSATSRLYRYFFCPRQMDLAKMQEALDYLVGTHDFRNLCKMDCEKVYNFERKIHSANVIKHARPEGDNDGQGIYFLEILGQAFLWHQIRCIAQVVFMVGRGLEAPSIIKELLDVEKYPGKPAYTLADEKPLVLHACRYPHLQIGYSVSNLWTVSCQLEKQWEEHTLAAARTRNFIDSLRSCPVLKDELMDFVTSKVNERNKKRHRKGRSQSHEEDCVDVSELYESCKDDEPISTMPWEDGLVWLRQLKLIPDSYGLNTSLHIPLMERSKGTTYEEKVEALKKSDKRRQKFEENIIKKRKTAEEDAAFYKHKTEQGGTGI